MTLRRSSVPFGRPFAYTDAEDLRTPQRRRYARIDHTLDWYRSWWQRLIHRRPVGWAVLDQGRRRGIPEATIHHGGELPVSPINHRFIQPVYDEDIILAAWAEMGIQDDFDPTEYPHKGDDHGPGPAHRGDPRRAAPFAVNPDHVATLRPRKTITPIDAQQDPRGMISYNGTILVLATGEQHFVTEDFDTVAALMAPTGPEHDSDTPRPSPPVKAIPPPPVKKSHHKAPEKPAQDPSLPPSPTSRPS